MASFRPTDLSSAATFDERLTEGQVMFAKSAYPEREKSFKSRENREVGKKIDGSTQNQGPELKDDSDMSVLLFPGQGAQFVGMAKQLLDDPDLPNVRDMFDRASQILDYDLLKVCLEGPEDRLRQGRI